MKLMLLLTLTLFSKMLVAVDIPIMRPTKPQNCSRSAGNGAAFDSIAHIEESGDMRNQAGSREVIRLQKNDHWTMSACQARS